MITREQFMEFFRSEEFHTKMTEDDCIEIFNTVLKGSSDITSELINKILGDYNVRDIIAVNSDYLETYFQISQTLVSCIDDPYVNNKATRTMQEQGLGGIYELAEDLTNKFQEKYKDNLWTEDSFYGILDNFLKEELD